MFSGEHIIKNKNKIKKPIMKRVVLIVAEFLFLLKVHHDESIFILTGLNDCIETSKEAESLNDELPELVLETETFDDIIDSVRHYKDNLTKDDPEMPSVEILLEKLETVEEESYIRLGRKRRHWSR